jgi:hypothetical protein
MPLRENLKYRCDTVHDVLVTELSGNLWKPSFLNYIPFQHINQVRVISGKNEKYHIKVERQKNSKTKRNPYR